MRTGQDVRKFVSKVSVNEKKKKKKEKKAEKRKTNTIFLLFTLVSSNSPVPVKQCRSGQYCCNPNTATSDCCLDDSRQFSLPDHNPDAKNTTGAAGSGGKGGRNGTDASGGVGGDGGNGRKSDRVTIGAAVGGALGGLAMIGGAVGVWLYLRKKKAKQGREMIAQEEADMGSADAMDPLEMKQVVEVGIESMAGQKYTPVSDEKALSAVMEMDSTAVYELGV